MTEQKKCDWGQPVAGERLDTKEATPISLENATDIALLVEVQLLRAAWSDVEKAAVRQYVVHLIKALEECDPSKIRFCDTCGNSVTSETIAGHNGRPLSSEIFCARCDGTKESL